MYVHTYSKSLLVTSNHTSSTVYIHTHVPIYTCTYVYMNPSSLHDLQVNICLGVHLKHNVHVLVCVCVCSSWDVSKEGSAGQERETL